ncbi:hypothetical protein SJ05684_b50650 (plasmid) [Sinorhizobium sojae CCBAU 05684]|uniref:Uncharacterized protein n=1 Tax=Sinorhizobium sojae CCBAU 05684 TaxID=716928 RepID=A0A249PJY0_9HYPH|nr:hypothetical protein [Sinorhizobium sojae]ASY66047.1 hypothetical protein SJ05684_b50650 [Sinorhizobium sojae CCBAU 05684]
MLDFAALGLWLNLAIFAGAAAVWIAGVRITHYTRIISDRTGVGQAFIGFVSGLIILFFLRDVSGGGG